MVPESQARLTPLPSPATTEKLVSELESLRSRLEVKGSYGLGEGDPSLLDDPKVEKRLSDDSPLDDRDPTAADQLVADVERRVRPAALAQVADDRGDALVALDELLDVGDQHASLEGLGLELRHLVRSVALDLQSQITPPARAVGREARGEGRSCAEARCEA